jgi:hypothetical protein
MEKSRSMSFIVDPSPTAVGDLEGLFELLLDLAEASVNLDHAQTATDAVRSLMQTQLCTTPFGSRRAVTSPVQRELIIPFASTATLR